MPINRGARISEINRRLAILANDLGLNNGQGLTDVNHHAEEFCRGMMNIVLGGIDLRNQNALRMDFPAIDLGDETARVCVQVTSTGTREKVRSTLKKFFDHGLDGKFDRLIVLVLGGKDRYTSSFDLERGFKFDPAEDVWDIKKLGAQIGTLTDTQLAELEQYLKNTLDIPDRPAPLFRLSLSSGLGEDGFVGREAELEKLGRAIRGNTKPVILSGLGGMGKTELAIRFGQNYTDGNVYFALFRETFSRTVTTNIAQGIPGLLERKLPEEEIYRIVMDRLMQCRETDLLILDNVEDVRERFSTLLAQLRRLPLRVLITTRTDAARAIEVPALSNDELYRIFENHRVRISQAEMDALIDAVEGHTLTVDLMARTMRGGWRKVTAQMLLSALAENSLAGQAYKEVASDYSDRQDRIYGHLRTVFDVAGIPETARSVLRCATLLPQGGMDPELFGNALPAEQQESLDDLLDHGWLRNEDSLTIHPVIRIVCREELTPTEDNCAPFLDALWDWYDPKRYDDARFRQLAELFAVASDDLEDRGANWAVYAGYLWNELMEMQKALTCNLRAVEKREKTQPETDALATAYNNVGGTYGDLGDHRKALEYKQKALAIRERVLPGDHPDLATSYNNVGGTYGDLGDHRKALEYLQKALAIRERVMPGDHPDLATSYNNVGGTYGDLGDHRKALEYKQKALAIRERVLPGDHPDLAAAYNNVGSTYGYLGDHRKALEYLEKALAIWERVLPGDHPDLAAAYNNVGSTYGHLGDHRKELEYLQKALAIRERVLPGDHPGLATSYNNVGLTYGDLGDHRKALEYLEKALAIRERVLPRDHPDLALSCHNIGVTYFMQGAYLQARDYVRRAVDIAERSLPEGHPHLAHYRRNLEAIESWCG